MLQDTCVWSMWSNERNPIDRQATENVREVKRDIEHAHSHYGWVAVDIEHYWWEYLAWQAGPGDHKELVRGDSPDVLGYLWAGQGPGRGAGTGPASHSSGLACPQLIPSSGRTRVSVSEKSLSFIRLKVTVMSSLNRLTKNRSDFKWMQYCVCWSHQRIILDKKNCRVAAAPIGPSLDSLCLLCQDWSRHKREER